METFHFMVISWSFPGQIYSSPGRGVNMSDPPGLLTAYKVHLPEHTGILEYSLPISPCAIYFLW